jgi:hypothetical protein
MALADDLAPVRVGEVWRWARGVQAAEFPPAGWPQPGFDDRSWGWGPSGFAFDSSAYEATLLPGFTVTNCVCLRREFLLDAPEGVVWMILRLDYSGGFVAFLNGAELARRGLPGPPGSPVPRDALADPHVRGTPEALDVSLAIPLLRSGTNTLAIQWHQSQGASLYGAALVPELLANFVRGPYLQNTSATTQHILWKTLLPADSRVEYGLTPALGLWCLDTNLVAAHEVVLTNLSPATTYYYRVLSSSAERLATSPPFAFRTLRAAGPFSFTFFADMGQGSAAQFAIADVVRRSEPDLVLCIGDLVYPTYTRWREDLRFFSVYSPHMRTTPYYVVAGNHDVVYGSERDFFAAFSMPTNSISPEEHAAAHTGPQHYYSFDHGEAHFVGLYVPLLFSYAALTNDAPQMRWLEADLASSAKPWKFMFLHHPVISSDGHRNDDYNANLIPDPAELGNLLWPVARRHGVQLILAGHDHVYERFAPVGGVYAVVSGGGGGPLYSLTQWDPATCQLWSRYHCVQVRGDRDQIELEALGSDGQPFDRMFLRRTPLPAEAACTAAWHSVAVEDYAGGNGDGNVPGQVFDFAGVPIPTLAGDFSNLGRVWVNRDHDHLYVGLEQVMIYPDNNVFVFVESPRKTGVTTMAGLGNGLVDPDGQGVDGLDFLENLAFANFRPCLGCVLGDEFADGQWRSFPRTNYVRDCTARPCVDVVRTNLALNTGQGVFWLDASLRTVEGVRLQQFNLSPETTPVPYEQNANFIEVAIPLAALALQSGDVIKLGAVVGGPQYDPAPDRQARFLDRSFLGRALTGSGLTPVILEGVAVDLGPDLDPDGDGLTTDEELRLGTNPALPDTDGDGLPDGWEVRFGLSPLSRDGDDGAAGDPDRDGFTNRDEYAAGTDPRDARSVLRLRVSVWANRDVRLAWPSVPGRRYQLEVADSLAGGFRVVPGFDPPRVATSAETFQDEPNSGGLPGQSRYYRIRLWP